MNFNTLLLTELLTQEVFYIFLPESPSLYKTSSVQFNLRVTSEVFLSVHSVNIEINSNIKVTFFFNFQISLC